MRRLLFWSSVSLAFCFGVSAHQRAAAPALIPAPSAAPHAAPSPVPTHATAAHPTRSSGSKPSTATTSTRQKSIPKPTPIIVPPVSSITTTTAGPCRGVGPAFGSYNACPSPVAGGGGIYGGAYYIPIPYYYGAAADAGPEELPPATQDVNQMIANDEAVPRPDDVPLQPQSASAPSAMGAGEINKALAEFVFVNRDGTKFNAVAYSFVNDKLQYVTKEGIRHSLPLDSLDLDATQKLNEQLGNTINLPNLPASGVALNQPVSHLN